MQQGDAYGQPDAALEQPYKASLQLDNRIAGYVGCAGCGASRRTIEDRSCDGPLSSYVEVVYRANGRMVAYSTSGISVRSIGVCRGG